MPKPLYFLLTILLGFAASSCEPAEEALTDAPVTLLFSSDTLYFDTLITEIPSRTFRFRAYNPSDNAVVLSEVKLGKGKGSPYSIIVNGVREAASQDIRLLGGDSLMVLVEANISSQDQDLPYVVKDSVIFEVNGQRQDVKLIAWGQDANFLRDSVLDCNTSWTARRPYVIYDNVLVPEGCQLSIEAGARIYMHNNANILVAGSLRALGTPQDSIVVTSTRQDEPYDRTPGQWGALVFLGTSQGNHLAGMHIRNGLFGIYVEPSTKPEPTDLNISKTIIENMAFAGVWSFGAEVSMDHCLVNNCLSHTIAGISGGKYTFQNCTFANYSFDFFREEPSVLLSNFAVLGGEQIIASSLLVEMQNCIVWGSLDEEFLYPEQLEGVSSEVNLTNCLVRSALAEGAFQNSGILREAPLFVDPEQQDFRLDTLSPARDAGLPTRLQTDLLGRPIVGRPDIGAYEFQP